MSKRAYFDGFVSFYRFNGQWDVAVFLNPPSNSDYYRIRIPIPREVAGEDVGEVTVNDMPEDDG